jgi:hypothetical protein
MQLWISDQEKQGKLLTSKLEAAFHQGVQPFFLEKEGNGA